MTARSSAPSFARILFEINFRAVSIVQGQSPVYNSAPDAMSRCQGPTCQCSGTSAPVPLPIRPECEPSRDKIHDDMQQDHERLGLEHFSCCCGSEDSSKCHFCWRKMAFTFVAWRTPTGEILYRLELPSPASRGPVRPPAPHTMPIIEWEQDVQPDCAEKADR